MLTQICVALAMVLGGAPAAGADQQVAGDAKDDVCHPTIELWKDRDQYGAYDKLSLGTGNGCTDLLLTTLHLRVVCQPSVEVVLDSYESGYAPFHTRYFTLPDRDRCPSFYATAELGVKDKKLYDQWAWDNGNYPA